MGMVIDRFPQYRLWKSKLLEYLREEFPESSSEISVTEHGTEYVLTIPDMLTPKQRRHILRHVCYRPESD
ncbi:hypothetical protein CEP54_012281 [Fusarium duplospermum]|uniref:Uncharacterized protein n=1 Tax=Fusarium duplospermum TaxID=1325734 RepID=A0A428P9V1_9HYPO|nr:hypothetical protein CEP54_012281 [Fusarium duplospermum]